MPYVKAIVECAVLIPLIPTSLVAQSCSLATQKLQVPEQIHLVGSCQVSPEIFPKLSFLFSEHGIDIYQIESPATENPTPLVKEKGTKPIDVPLPRIIQRQALFVFQDEDERQRQIQRFINAGEAISWLRGGYRYDSTLPADWTPVLSVKYATYTFSIFTLSGQTLLTNVSLYAPSACYAYDTRCVDGGLEPSVLKSSEIAIYSNRSPSPLPVESLEYRVAAVLLSQARAQKIQPNTPSSVK